MKNESQVCIRSDIQSGVGSGPLMQAQTVEHHVRDIEVGGLVRIGYAKQVRFTKATQVIEPATGSDSGSEDSWIEVGGEKD